MAGTPIRRAERAKLRAEIDEFCSLLSEGLTDREACRRFGINIGVLYKACQEEITLAEKITLARKAGAEAMMSMTVDIADELKAEVFADPVRVAQTRIQVRQQIAKARNKEVFGEQRGLAVQVNIGSLHLDALKAAQAPALPAPQEEILDAEFEQQLNLNDLL